MAGQGGGRPSPYVWVGAGGVALVVIALAISQFALRDGAGLGGRAGSEDRTALDAAPSPKLVRDTPLRTGPETASREVARAPAGTPVRVIGRLEDGVWYRVEVVGRLDAVGWVRASALAGVDPASVAVLPASQTDAVVAGAPGGDLPNLVVDGVSVRDNGLVVALSNDGYADLPGPFTVTVNKGAPHTVQLPGRALRPGDRFESVLEREYVQRRASISVAAQTSTPEGTLDDNRLDATVEPDQPLDLEVTGVTTGPQFAVTVRNNGSIPLVGALTVTVRETQPTDRLLVRLDDAPLNIERGGTQVFRVPGAASVDPARMLVLIDTVAINDDDLSNDVYPR